MDHKRLVDRELLATLEAYPGFNFTPDTLPAIREQFGNRPVREDRAVEVSRLIASSPAGPDVAVVRYAPAGPAEGLPALLHIHGGGFVIGAPQMVDEQSKTLVKTLGCVVISVDYRLAPETPFPGAVEDCHSALTWLFDRAEQLGVDRERIAIGGESAGGGLAAALSLLNRDRAALPVCFQYLTYPMLDHRTGREGPSLYDEAATWKAEDNRFAWDALLGPASELGVPSPYASPARADDLMGLPPTLICVGALDLFLAEGVDYARRLIMAGVPTELHVYPGAFHGFDQVADAAVSRRFYGDLTGALRRAFEPGRDDAARMEGKNR